MELSCNYKKTYLINDIIKDMTLVTNNKVRARKAFKEIIFYIRNKLQNGEKVIFKDYFRFYTKKGRKYPRILFKPSPNFDYKV